MEQNTLDVTCITAIRNIYNHIHFIAPGTGIRKALKYSTVSGRTLNTWCRINYQCNLRTLLTMMSANNCAAELTDHDISRYRGLALWGL